jgi:predicted kinase
MSSVPAVILIAGPAGAGKSTVAACAGQEPGWVHVSEDEAWSRLKPRAGHRTPEQQDIIHAQVARVVEALVAGGYRVVLEFILFEDPPRPLLYYQEALTRAGIAFTTRVLRPDVDELMRRIEQRGRPNDRGRSHLRTNAEHQWRILGSSHIDPATIIDSTDLTAEEVFERYFEPLLAV